MGDLFLLRLTDLHAILEEAAPPLAGRMLVHPQLSCDGLAGRYALLSGSSRHSRPRSRYPPPAPRRSAASRSSRATDRHRRSFRSARAGSSCRQSSMISSNQVAVSNPTLPGTIDHHRKATCALAARPFALTLSSYPQVVGNGVIDQLINSAAR